MTEAPSPFIPGTNIQMAWDSTSLGWLKDCPRKYFYSMIEGWRAKADAPNLTFGIHYHSALEWYDRLRADGKGHDEASRGAVRKALTDSFGWASDHNTKNRETLIRSIIWYLEEFKDHSMKTWILANGKPAVELSFRVELDFGVDNKDGTYQPYMLSGHIDRIVEFDNDLYSTDRKTTSSALSSYYFNQFSPNNQMSLYSMASRVVFATPIKGVIIDAAQVMVGFTRYLRGMTDRTPAQTEEWLDDTKHWIRQAEGYANEGYWPHNDSACQKFGGCQFLGICSKDPGVRETFLKTDFVQAERWNPLRPR